MYKAQIIFTYWKEGTCIPGGPKVSDWELAGTSVTTACPATSFRNYTSKEVFSCHFCDGVKGLPLLAVLPDYIMYTECKIMPSLPFIIGILIKASSSIM